MATAGESRRHLPQLNSAPPHSDIGPRATTSAAARERRQRSPLWWWHRAPARTRRPGPRRRAPTPASRPASRQAAAVHQVAATGGERRQRHGSAACSLQLPLAAAAVSPTPAHGRLPAVPIRLPNYPQPAHQQPDARGLRQERGRRRTRHSGHRAGWVAAGCPRALRPACEAERGWRCCEKNAGSVKVVAHVGSAGLWPPRGVQINDRAPLRPAINAVRPPSFPATHARLAARLRSNARLPRRLSVRGNTCSQPQPW